MGTWEFATVISTFVYLKVFMIKNSKVYTDLNFHSFTHYWLILIDSSTLCMQDIVEMWKVKQNTQNALVGHLG